MRQVIGISKNVLAGMLEHAKQRPAEECCGLLGGRGGVITKIFAARNSAAEPAKNYEIAPEELFRLVREIRGGGFQMLGIYHSHPNGVNEPSPRDIERAYYPEAAYFIVSPQAGASVAVRAFSIRDGLVSELTMEVALD